MGRGGVPPEPTAPPLWRSVRGGGGVYLRTVSLFPLGGSHGSPDPFGIGEERVTLFELFHFLNGRVSGLLNGRFIRV